MTVIHRAAAGPQYQSTIDPDFGLSHGSFMEFDLAGRAAERPLLSVVDDDEALRESLPDLLKTFGFAVRVFSSAEEFLSSDYVDETKCLILDVVMPGMSGPELYLKLKHRRPEIPVVFMTAQRDVTIRARLLNQGAAGFLLKPFSDTALLATVSAAMGTHQA